MEGDVLAVVQSIQLVAHVLEQQPVLLRIHLQPALEQAQDELDSLHRDQTALVDIDYVPGVLEIADVGVRQ